MLAHGVAWHAALLGVLRLSSQYSEVDAGFIVQIDILIVVCSCFAPTPSIASMIVNRFKLRTDILSHNIAGMGCSAGDWCSCMHLYWQLLTVMLHCSLAH